MNLDDLNALSPRDQVQLFRCPGCRTAPYSACFSQTHPGTCPRRWEALRTYRSELAFIALGGVFHTGVPCSHCGAKVHQYCDSRTPACYSRVEASVRAASRLAMNYTGTYNTKETA